MKAYASERFFRLSNKIAFIIISLTMVGPLLHLLAISLSDAVYINAKSVFLWPKGINFEAYRYIFQQTHIWRSLLVSVYITVVGTAFCLLLTSSLAYSLSRRIMKGRKWILKGIIISFIFSVPLIPFYLVVKELHMLDTLWSLIIPGALGAFNVIIMKTFMQGISSEMIDAAQIDGCSEYRIYALIALPLSLPALATIGLFHAVTQWNAYFHALIFIRDKSLYPVQVVLKGLVVDQGALDMMSSDLLIKSPPEQMMAAIILFATFPILLVYPFIQKYFVKGAMLGALKE